MVGVFVLWGDSLYRQQKFPYNGSMQKPGCFAFS